MYHEGMLYKTMVWLTRLAYLNLLWLFFSIVGLLLFGFFPSVVAAMAIERKWIRGNRDFPLFRQFWSEFKNNFMQANVIGYFFILLIMLIYVNITLVQSMDHWLQLILLYLLFGLAFLVSIIFVYIFPTVVHYDATFFEYITYAFVVALVSPLHTILILINIGAFFFIGYYFPGVVFVFTGSGLTFITMWFSYQSLKKVENKTSLYMDGE
ncbi:YesL family protein [Gracilibacillus sp. HCP3S3_G5_1]|uniref:YesL family protein n=1 Tax=unclassified Gracilibacillus TaxID=2625209 RepID=UPI003F89DACB